jgi:ubiquinone/menaquinone biosynthesis C-methylase UbiE
MTEACIGGYYDDENINFSQAAQRLTDVLIEKSGISSQSTVLDVGCGNGITALYIANKFGCKTIGVDLSGVRVKNALKNLKAQPENIQDIVQFIKSSATTLPFENNFFSNILSQSSI